MKAGMPSPNLMRPLLAGWVLAALTALGLPSSLAAQPRNEEIESVLHAQLAEEASPLAPVTINGERSVVTTDGNVRLESDGSISGLGHLAPRASLAPLPRGVIVQLSQPPLLAVAASGRATAATTAQAGRSLASHAEQLSREHKKAKMLVLGARPASTTQVSPGAPAGPKITREFVSALNGFAVSGMSVAEAQKALATMPGIRVFDDVAVHTSLSESVNIIRASEVWKPTQGAGLDGTGTTIGIIDTGVDYTHPDLGGCFGAGCKVAGGYDFVNNDSDPMDDHGHGTHVAATAAGNGTYHDSSGASHPLPGVAPGARIFGYKVLSSAGYGSSSDIIAAIERCADPNLDGDFSDHLDVCSLSLGGSGDPNDPMSLAIDLASSNGVVFTVAAGNSGPAASTVSSPGTAREAITVAAACKPGSTSAACANSPIASFSSRGPIPNFPDVTKPDVSAPGVDICAARFGSFASGRECKDSTHISISGTSMATPHVAGLAAIIRQSNPTLSAAQVKAIIVGTASDLDVDATIQGSGMIDAVAAVAAAGQPYAFLRFQGGTPVLRYTPNRLVQEHNLSVSIVNTSEGALSIAPSAPNPVEGVSVSFPNGSVSLAAGETRTIPMVVSVDHRLRISERISVPLVFSTPLGDASLTMVLDIGSALSVSASKLNFGISTPEDSAFAATRELTLSNSITDASLTYSISTTGWLGEQGAPSRFTTTLTPSSVTVPAGGSVAVSATVSSNGDPGSNGLHTSLLQISGNTIVASVPMSLWQGYSLRISYGATTPWYVTMGSHEPRPGSVHGELLTIVPEWEDRFSTVYIRTSGAWDVASLFAAGESNSLILKTVTVAGAETTLKTPQDEATVSHVSTLPPVGGILFYAWSFSPKLGGREMSVNPLTVDFRGGSSITVRTNPISSDWTFSACAAISPFVEDDVMQPLSVLHFHRDGPFDTSFQMDPGPLRPYAINAVSQANPAAPVQLNTLFGTKTLSRNGLIEDQWVIGSSLLAQPDEVPIVLGSGFQDVAPGAGSAADLPFASFLVGSYQSPEMQGPTVTFSRDSAFIYDDSRFISRWSLENWETPYSYAANAFFGPRIRAANQPNVITVGVGPLVDTSRWYNLDTSSAALVPRTGLKSSWYAYGGTARARGFLPYADSTFAEPAPEYVVERDGVVVQAGSVGERYACPPHLPDSCVAVGHNLHQLTLPRANHTVVPGRYSVRLSRDATIGGVATSVVTTSAFSVPPATGQPAAPTDENPPSLRDLHVSVGGIWQSGIDPSRTNVIDFSLDPTPGLGGLVNTPGELHHEQLPDSLHDVRLLQSGDKLSWDAVSLESLPNGSFVGQPTVQPGTAVYHFRIEAADAAGNDFSYTFSLPTTPARSLASPDSLPVVVTLDNISNSSPYSTSDVVAISVRAQNVISGSKIEAIANGQVLELVPYAAADRGQQQVTGFLRTADLKPGKVSVSARVTDVLGRSGTSTAQSFTIESDSPSLNSISLSMRPSSQFRLGSKVVFSVKTSGPAADSLQNVAVMANGKPACRFMRQPYVCSWRVPLAPRNSLRLRARATDDKGNLIRSPLSHVTVRH